MNQEVIAESLGSLGHEFVIVENGSAALTAAQSGDYDLVLMDCRMPGLDGFDATRAIRKAEIDSGTGAHIPIVALSANAMKGDRELCLASGMDDHMAKPFTLSGLSAKLRRWLPQAVGANDVVGIAPKDSVVESAATSEDDICIIDETALRRIVALQRPGRPNVLAKIVGIFIATAPFALEQLQDALKKSDFVAARDLAHSLKSSSANLGATDISERCAELEAFAVERKVESAQAKLTSIRDRFPALKSRLERYLEGGGVASPGASMGAAIG